MKKYILRRCIKGNEAYGGFVYPESGIVECQDWKDNKECGNGLHGRCDQSSGHFQKDLQGNFLVIEVDTDDGFVDLGDKVKFKKGNIIYCGDELSPAKKIMLQHYPNMIFHWDNVTQPRRSTATQGCGSTATQGYRSTATQGDGSTATQGYGSTATQGYGSTATQGDCSTATQGDCSTATQGDGSFLCLRLDQHIAKQGEGSIISYIGDKKKSWICGLDHMPGEVVYIDNGSMTRYTHTPDEITSLLPHECFIFGSNMNGNHIGGAAKTALSFGAVEGSVGLMGQSYGFNTLNESMQQLSHEELLVEVQKLYDTVKEKFGIYYLTKVGCGIAGYSEEYMKSLFVEAPVCIIKPKGW